MPPTPVPNLLAMPGVSTTVVVDQQTTDGGKESQYQYQGLPAGTYTFICSIHPSIMHGTLTVH